MKQIKRVVLTYKAFTNAFMVMTLILLIRIPLGTFNDPSSIDVVGHFVMLAAGGPLLAMVIQELRIFQNFGKASFIFLTFLLGTAAEVLWEIFEYCIDVVFHLQWQPSNADTMTDIILAVMGSVVGALLFARLYRASLSYR